MPSSLLPTSKTTRKHPRERLISNGQMDTFCGRDTITSLAGLNETSAPDGFEFKKSNNHSLFYNLVFDEETKLDESTKGQFLKPKERPPYSVEMIRHRLYLRHTSFQTYKQLREKFPLPSISLLNKIQQGGVNSIKTLKILRENGKISNDCILMVDGMYLEKLT